MSNFAEKNLMQWLNYLENRHAQEIKLGLPRIREVANRLQLLQWSIPVITVTGTNGKGSTIAALEAIYQEAGYRVASFTSPHLLKFNERIRINGNLINDDDLCAAFSVVHDAEGESELRYFETVTLAALWYFKKQKPDILLLEVGMGGRQDATNIIDANIAIITTVEFDHQEYLGDTLEKIGYEKAGIIKPKSVLVYADENPPRSVMQYAKELGVSTYTLGKDYQYELVGDKLIIQLDKNIQLPKPKLHPKAATAALIASILLKDKIPLKKEDLIHAMEKVYIPGRQQLIKQPKPTIFDVAHNPQAARLLAEFIKNQGQNKKIHAVFSALKDKDSLGLIEPLYKLVNFWYPAMLTGKRANTKEDLMTIFNQFNLSTEYYDTPEMAYQAACQNAAPDDLIVVYGSFLTVSAVMQGLYFK